MAAETKEQTRWHRLLALLLTDYLAGSPYRVEPEKDLSMKARR